MKSIRNIFNLASSAALISGGAMALALLASPAQAQTAASVTAFCQTGAAPTSLEVLPASAKSNLCQWMKEAEVSPARFDVVLARSSAAGNTAAALKQALQAEADVHARNASALAKSDYAAIGSEREAAKAAFYERVGKLVM